MKIVKLNRIGISSIVATLLIVLITLAALAVFWVAFQRASDTGDGESSLECLSIDLKPVGCYYYHAGTLVRNVPLPYDGIFVISERGPGRGGITGAKFVYTDLNGNSHVEDPISFPSLRIGTDYNSTKEYTTKEGITLDISYTPVTFNVAAVVSEHTCNLKYEPVNCQNGTYLLEQGLPAN